MPLIFFPRMQLEFQISKPFLALFPFYIPHLFSQNAPQVPDFQAFPSKISLLFPSSFFPRMPFEFWISKSFLALFSFNIPRLFSQNAPRVLDFQAFPRTIFLQHPSSFFPDCTSSPRFPSRHLFSNSRSDASCYSPPQSRLPCPTRPPLPPRRSSHSLGDGRCHLLGRWLRLPLVAAGASSGPKL